MNTTENNKLIAEFMGKQIYQKHHKSNYHCSWDWLMPVIAKISDLCKEPQELDNLKYSLLSADINTAFNEVLEFIKEHNKQI